LDTLEQQLNDLRPARLPAATQRLLLQEMQRPTTRRGWAFWQFAHRTGFQVALASALSLAVLMGWPMLSGSLRTASPVKPPLAYWETELAAACPMGENTVAVLRSPTILTNLQIRR
jgi:hypothetical protein